MPITYHIDKVKKVLHSIGTGVLTREAIRTYRNSLLDDPEFDHCCDCLFDFRGVTELRISAKDMEAIAMGAIFDRCGRKAHVVPSDSMFGALRMYYLHLDAEPHEVQVFRDMDEACRWLGLD